MQGSRSEGGCDHDVHPRGLSFRGRTYKSPTRARSRRGQRSSGGKSEQRPRRCLRASGDALTRISMRGRMLSSRPDIRAAASPLGTYLRRPGKGPLVRRMRDAWCGARRRDEQRARSLSCQSGTAWRSEHDACGDPGAARTDCNASAASTRSVDATARHASGAIARDGEGALQRGVDAMNPGRQRPMLDSYSQAVARRMIAPREKARASGCGL